jgi:isocitrate lyase
MHAGAAGRGQNVATAAWRSEKRLHQQPRRIDGRQALQQAKAGIEAIYLSGWQVAADANLASSMYPDQSLYPANSVLRWSIGSTTPSAARIRSSGRRGLKRAIRAIPTISCRSWRMPAGFGGVLNAFELMKSMIEAGAAAVHFEDQLASVKKCGHMGGKVLVPTQEAIQKLVAARLAADVMGVRRW